MSKKEVLVALQDMANHDPAGAEHETEEFWNRAVEAAKCKDREELDTLMSVVKQEGWDGGPAHWEELLSAHGLEGVSFPSVLERVRDAIREAPEDVTYLDPEYAYNTICTEHADVEDHTDDCLGEPNVVASRTYIAQQEFKWYVEIYGGLP